jgi:hypothetical protein
VQQITGVAHMAQWLRVCVHLCLLCPTQADIYTSLEIYAGNAKEFGLKVSLYSS